MEINDTCPCGASFTVDSSNILHARRQHREWLNSHQVCRLENAAKPKGLDEAQLKHYYDMGFDCGKNGANTKNCHFSLFGTAEGTRAWERGKADAEKELDK